MAVAITSFEPTGGTAPHTASGRSGTTVVITGSDFEASQGAGSVTFGGHTATISAWADTEITCVIDGTPSTGNQTMLVTNNSASSASDVFWLYEVDSIIDSDWNSKQHYQKPGAAGDSNPEDRTVSDSRDLNRAIEHIDHLKRWANGDPITQFVCILRKGNAQSIPDVDPASGLTDVEWDTTSGPADVEVLDPAGMHSDVTAVKHRITVPAGGAGVYLVVANLLWSADFTTNYKVLRLTQYNSSDTALWIVGNDHGASSISQAGRFATASMIVTAAAGDYFKVSVAQNSGSAQTLSTALATGFSAARLWGL